ncbi:hypothetical protein [Roseovarius sp. ZX-A-9]|uniref:hypothetical protein n=1 Tax=Roseovarius sp. ZX-A-9 TaxID=3014783 RepID=UPI00232FD277|nr:hypothetical protein [Roseovarius sp. ZX-A-9]
MKSAKTVWDKVLSDPQKDAVLKHFQAAERARSAKNDATTNKELDASPQASRDLQRLT